LTDKVEMEAHDKFQMVPKSQGVVAHRVLHRWFADVSGLGLAEQARMLMRPALPKRGEELAEHVELRQGKMRSLGAHGDEFTLAPVCKFDALRMLMVGKAKEYFDLWEAHRDNTDQAKSYEELLAKVQDFQRRRKLDGSAPWMLEPWDDGPGAKTQVEDTTKMTSSTFGFKGNSSTFGFKGNSKGKGD
jgi:hypothetical protein